MHSVEYQVNRKQQPTMMTDLDHTLICKHRSSGQTMSHKELKARAMKLYSKQCQLKLYEPCGEKISPLMYGVNEEYMRNLLNDPPTVEFGPVSDCKASYRLMEFCRQRRPQY